MGALVHPLAALVANRTHRPLICLLLAVNVTVVVLLVATIACADDDNDDKTGPGTSEPVDWGPLAVIHEDFRINRPEQERGLGPGVLTIDEECVVFTVTEDGSEVTLVWRDSQTAWEAERQRIRFDDPSLEVIELAGGEVLSLSGYLTPASESTWVEHPDESCPEEIFIMSDLGFGGS